MTPVITGFNFLMSSDIPYSVTEIADLRVIFSVRDDVRLVMDITPRGWVVSSSHSAS